MNRKKLTFSHFHSMTSLIITIGGALSVIIGLIGIVNFIQFGIDKHYYAAKRICYAPKYWHDRQTAQTDVVL